MIETACFGESLKQDDSPAAGQEKTNGAIIDSKDDKATTEITTAKEQVITSTSAPSVR